MARVTLTVQLMHAQQRIAVLERELHEANERCAQLEAAQQPRAQAQGQIVGRYVKNGVRMVKVRISDRVIAHRPEAAHA